ncbi:hypothetical protein [Dietzia cinnamea]|uniref:hypothetical protein n=1 Tax=Dietzia cinnamea TaxID=321318 RepID=UPI0019584306|nr:hypothetical protein [Dietzia cinnamea]MBM7231974.1 hypothetical protein [Dietzia cinnamea]MCT2077458.1 hypothetical protein [Dietzia cinnamea]MCT2107571.1 hypothetical protein [Dietzia cinnamea]MCT2221791.1 hypothetical protein [Dietzia cinnamea]MCT2265801.1 hypothetical protein [Dietzia cinnamea]
MKKVVPVWWFAVPHDAICFPRQWGLSWPGAPWYPTAPHVSAADAAAVGLGGGSLELAVVDVDSVELAVVDACTVVVTVAGVGAGSSALQAARRKMIGARAASAAAMRECISSLTRKRVTPSG